MNRRSFLKLIAVAAVTPSSVSAMGEPALKLWPLQKLIAATLENLPRGLLETAWSEPGYYDFKVWWGDGTRKTYRRDRGLTDE